MVTSVHTVICQVKDMGVATRFYTDVLGLSPGIQSPSWPDFSDDRIKIGLHPPSSGGSEVSGKG